MPAGTCKYHPSCSEYAIEALRKHGLVKGSALACWRASALQPVVARRGRLPVMPPRSSCILDRSRTSVRWLLERFHYNLGLTWAWAIVATTIVVRICLVPLTVRQIHSMQSLQRHAPEMKEIQRKYKGDKQKQNEELMKFYRENKINPAASCLPMVAQFPVFISLYLVLKHFSKHIPPGSDLSWLHFVPNITAPANSNWSGYVLLAVYAGSQICSTYFMSTSMDKTQRRIMMFLPLIFITVIAHFPTGLVIYWVTTNLWTVGQGLVTRRLVPEDRASPAPRARSARSRTPRARPTASRATAPTGAEPPAPKPKPQPQAPAAAAPREAEQGPRPAVSGERTVEATGETVGEAKWRALRELELLVPSLDKAAVRFQVLSEGERGLLGVGYTPARVLATAAEGERRREAPAEPGRERGRPPAARRCSTQVTAAIGVRCRIEIERDGRRRSR